MTKVKTKSKAVKDALKNMKHITKLIENLGWQPTIIDMSIPADENDVQITCMMSSPNHTGMVAKIRYGLSPSGYSATCTCTEINSKIHKYECMVFAYRSSAEAVDAAMSGDMEDLVI